MWIVWICFAQLLILFLLSRLLTQNLSKWLLIQTRSIKTTIHLIAFIFFPGVVVHEMAHFLTAIVLFVPVGEVNLWPKMHGETVRLGSVQVGKTDPLRNALIGLAPILFGTTVIVGSLYYSFYQQSFFSLPWWGMLLLFYIVFVVGNTMFSSRKDVEGLLPLLILLVIVGLTAFFLGFRFQLTFPQKLIDFLWQTSGFLAVPIVVDVGAIGSLHFLLGRR